MLIRPRLTDHFGIHVAQAELDFAIPFLDEDIPLYVDPFLLWRSPSQQDQALHTSLLHAFNQLGHSAQRGGVAAAVETLIRASECPEVGLGTSANRAGKRIGSAKAQEILKLFSSIPRYGTSGFRHIEEVQLYVDGISKDRISDIACSFLKSFLIDFTVDQCAKLGIPMRATVLNDVYDYRSGTFHKLDNISLPLNPADGSPILFVPKRWLRFVPWINFDDYFSKSCPQDEISHSPDELSRVEVLNYNRENYGVIDGYITLKERNFQDCANDPLFSQIPISSAKKKWTAVSKLPTGKEGGSDIKYENFISQLLPSLLYPTLDFAQAQARTDSGVSIRDLIFYNTRAHTFLEEVFSDYGSRQITFELKNVRAVERLHIDQVNRYLADELGRFGVLVTRNPLPKAEFKRTIDLWSGQRKAVIALTDADVSQMVDVFESKQRSPIDVLIKKYVEFRRSCP